MKHIRPLPTISYDVCDVIFINEQKQCHENDVKLFSKTALSILWNANFYNQFLNRVAENTKIVHKKTFIPTNNYNLSYIKESRSNPSLSLLTKSFKYDKWKPLLISESLIFVKLL